VAVGPPWIPCCIAIGSNLNDPVAQVRWALDALRGVPQSNLQATSGLYKNPPMGPADQPLFVNAAALLLTRLDARVLLQELQSLERQRGRKRSPEQRWGPRSLDLDILTYGDYRITESELTIPHPGISERNFVLFPLLDVAPRLNVPGGGPVYALAAALDGSDLEKID